MKGSMTQGKPFGLILRFSIPLLLGNLFQQTYNMVDAAIVGQTLGADALAAVGSSSSVQFFCAWICHGNVCRILYPGSSEVWGGRLFRHAQVHFFRFHLGCSTWWYTDTCDICIMWNHTAWITGTI